MKTKIAYWPVGAVLALTFAVGFLTVALTRTHAAVLQPIGSSLDIGSTGQDVTTLQTLLASSPSLYPAGLVTGYYGLLTKTAVAQFQIAHNLPPVGRVGPLTLARLNTLIASGATTIDVDSPSINAARVTTTGTSAIISWNTNEPTIGRVHYSAMPITMLEPTASKTVPQTSGTAIAEQTAGTAHSVIITGLNPHRTYYYSIASIDFSENVSVILSSPFVTP